MSISSSLAHKYDEFDEYAPTTKFSAYEELKAWCEKYLQTDEYLAEADNGEGFPHIDFYLPCKSEIVVWFKPDGSYDFTEIYD